MPIPPAWRLRDPPAPIFGHARCTQATACTRSVANTGKQYPSVAPAARADTSKRFARPPAPNPSRRVPVRIARPRDAPSPHSDWPMLVPSALPDPVRLGKRDPLHRFGSRGFRFQSYWEAALLPLLQFPGTLELVWMRSQPPLTTELTRVQCGPQWSEEATAFPMPSRT